MSTIKYKCNTCKREVELLENQNGLTVIGRCVLTNGCFGKLQPIARNPYNIRETYDYYDNDLSELYEFNSRNKFFNHHQINKNTIWRIKHNLNNHPFVVVFVNTGNGIKKLDKSNYSINYIDSNNLIVNLDNASGVAHCIARTSQHDIIKYSEPTEQMTQVTVGGTFTFAIPKLLTKIDTPTPTPTPSLPLDLQFIGDIELEIGITKPNEEEVICFEKIPTTQIASPWVGINEILIRNRRNYYVKMKNILQFTTFDNANLTFSDIPDGTKIRFIRINYGTGIRQSIPSRGAFVLLSTYPHKIHDKTLDKILDLGEIVDTQYWYMTYNGGEVYINTNAIESTYPHIRKVS
jgi:hypothetical protein